MDSDDKIVVMESRELLAMTSLGKEDCSGYPGVY